jgi:hypothetical protein
VLDINKAGDDIQKMSGGRGYSTEKAAPDATKPGDAAQGADLKPTPAQDKEEDPMEAVRRALEADKAKK